MYFLCNAHLSFASICQPVPAPLSGQARSSSMSTTVVYINLQPLVETKFLYRQKALVMTQSILCCFLRLTGDTCLLADIAAEIGAKATSVSCTHLATLFSQPGNDHHTSQPLHTDLLLSADYVAHHQRVWPVPRSAAEDPNGAHCTLDVGGRAGSEEGLPLHLAHVGGHHIGKKRLERTMRCTL